MGISFIYCKKDEHISKYIKQVARTLFLTIVQKCWQKAKFILSNLDALFECMPKAASLTWKKLEL